MPAIHVCSLARVQGTVSASGASHLVSVLNEGTPVVRPVSIPAERHLYLGFADITEPMEGMSLPSADHIERLIGFLERWDRQRPIVIHCFAGISRSTAAAFITLCATAPHCDERELALKLRRASAFACPNPLMVSLADDILGRAGRMRAAVREIGRGTECFVAEPFMLPLGG